ncbi:DUF3888 domain-containing protein [Scopulibacillus darangshiensis]|nr:DUF3888 domain-containing protein [Scopulibacillus darangshiensis]
MICLFIIALLTFASNMPLVHAESRPKHKHDSKGMEQASDQLYLTLFDQRIHDAVTNYYKDDSIRMQYNWWDKNYDVVEVDQSEKGHILEYPYKGKKQQFAFTIKFTVLTYKNTKPLGTDSITFGIQHDSDMGVKIKMLGYDHHPKK